MKDTRSARRVDESCETKHLQPRSGEAVLSSGFRRERPDGIKLIIPVLFLAYLFSDSENLILVI